MVEHEESLMEKIAEKIHGHNSSSDSDDDKPSKTSPTRIPEVQIPKDPVLECAQSLRFEINCAFSVLQDIASGRYLKKFLSVIASLWVLSIVGSWCNFLTLFYIVFILLHTVLVLYEKYEDKVDPFAEKAMHEIKKQCAVLNTKFLRFRGDG